MDAPSLSVIVCSAGRPDLLDGCVDMLLALEGWTAHDEVVVVLNGAERAAARARVAARLHAPLAVTVRVEELGRAGLSAARNCGAGVAGGDVLVYLDDDARPTPDWLSAWRDAFAVDRELAAAGGPIESRWPDRPPRWFDPRLSAYWSELDHRDPSSVVDAPVALRGFGANLGVRAAALRSVGGFDERLGRGSPVPGGEETDVLGRLDDAGRSIGWVAGARVRHLVGPDRTRLIWLLRRAHEQGRIDRALGAPPVASHRVVTSGWRALIRDLRREPGDWRRHLAVDLARRTRLAGRSRPIPRR
jgi:GT2 family glycosyltransferase